MNKRSVVPFICLVLAIIFLYSRQFIQNESPTLDIPAQHSSIFSQDILTLHYHERAPYYSTGPYGVYGICADPVKQALKKAGISYVWEKTPATRQIELLKENSSRIGLIGWFKNQEREKFAKYSHYIYQDKPAIVLARSDNQKISSGITLRGLFENRSNILLRKEGYSYGPIVDSAISKFKPRQEITNSENIGLLKMIHSGRADYFFISEEEAGPLISSSGLLQTDFKYIRILGMPEGNRRYLLFSRKVEDDIINRIDAQLKKIINSGN